MNAWPLVPIKDVARIVGGSTPKSGTAEFWDGHIPWATPKDLSDLNGKFIDDTPRRISQSGLNSCSSELLPPNSVLFSSRAPIGHVAINTVPMATNQGFKSFVPKPRIDASYLYWWLKCHRSDLERLGNGATFKEVSKAVVERIEIPLPPLEEQKRIAAILDQADDIRRKRQHAIERLNQLGQAIFHEMFGDLSAPETFKSRYESTTLGNVVTVKGGGTPSKSNENFYTGDIPWVSPKDMKSWEIESAQDNITQDAIDKSSTTLLPKNSVLIVNRSGILKHTLPVGIARRRVAINQDLKALICNEKVRPDFIAHLVKAAEPMVLTWVRATTADNFPIDNLKNMEIPVPSIEIQDKFVDVVGKIKLNFEVNRVSERKFSNLFASLQRRAFAGEL